jgi:hypothetical protein
VQRALRLLLGPIRKSALFLIAWRARELLSPSCLDPRKLRKNRLLLRLLPRAHFARRGLLRGLDLGGLPREEQPNPLLAEMSQLTGRLSAFSFASLVLDSARDMLN